MDITKKLLTLLAIFCVIASAGVVCAADAGNHSNWVGINHENISGVPESHYMGSNDRSTDTSIINHNVTPVPHAAGEPVENESASNGTVEGAIGSNSVSQNASANGTGNDTGNATTYPTMQTTGNPILGLLAVGAILGGATIINRKK